MLNIALNNITIHDKFHKDSNIRVVFWRLFIHHESKKQDTKLLPITSPNVNLLTYCQNSFTGQLSDKLLNLQQTHDQISNHTLNMSLHYLVKYQCQKTHSNLKYVL